jgi:hypothetical protein
MQFLQEQKIVPATGLYDPHGCGKCRFCMEQKSAVHPWTYTLLGIPATGLYRPSLDIKKTTLETRVAKQVISLMRESVPCELLLLGFI